MDSATITTIAMGLISGFFGAFGVRLLGGVFGRLKPYDENKAQLILSDRKELAVFIEQMRKENADLRKRLDKQVEVQIATVREVEELRALKHQFEADRAQWQTEKEKMHEEWDRERLEWQSERAALLVKVAVLESRVKTLEMGSV